MGGASPQRLPSAGGGGQDGDGAPAKESEKPKPKRLVPILALDVWEHAYYLEYQNRRGEYVDNFWKVVNWYAVSQYYEHHASQGRAVDWYANAV